MSLEEIETISTESTVLLENENVYDKDECYSVDEDIADILEVISTLSKADDALPQSEESSWTDSVEYFVEQLNDVGINYDSDNETFLGSKYDDDDKVDDGDDGDDILSESEEEEESTVKMLKKNERFLIYLAVPVILSQLIMIIMLTSNGAQAKPEAIVLSPITIKVHHYHYHFAEESTSKSSGFLYYFFNPFAPIFNNRYSKQAITWAKNEINNPHGAFKYVKHYFNSIATRLAGLNGKLLGGIESEIGKAVKMRDNWNRAVYEKIYKVAATPRYQEAAGKVFEWASKLKEKFFQ